MKSNSKNDQKRPERTITPDVQADLDAMLEFATEDEIIRNRERLLRAKKTKNLLTLITPNPKLRMI
jgi:lysophospholipase L1-like esterase